MSGVDWNKVRERLESVRTAVERGWAPEPEEAKRILQARAGALAREVAEPRAAETLDLVAFVLAEETYGVESSFVREISALTDLTPMPCTPAFVLGIVNVRGEILSVLDIRKFFELPERGLTDLNKVIVLQSGDMSFAVLADSILGVRSVPLAEIQPSLPTLKGIREKYLRGVTHERMVVLDAGKLLADETIIVQEEAEQRE